MDMGCGNFRSGTDGRNKLLCQKAPMIVVKFDQMTQQRPISHQLTSQAGKVQSWLVFVFAKFCSHWLIDFSLA